MQEVHYERWKIKTLEDGLIPSGSIAHTTVHRLANKHLPDPGETDVRLNIEHQTVGLTGILIGYGHEDDSDLHLVVKDQRTAETMNCEIPMGSYAPKHAALFDSLRAEIEGRFEKTSIRKIRKLKHRARIKINGILFVDKLHGKDFEARNGVEIHPVMKIKFD